MQDDAPAAAPAPIEATVDPRRARTQPDQPEAAQPAETVQTAGEAESEPVEAPAPVEAAADATVTEATDSTSEVPPAPNSTDPLATPADPPAAPQSSLFRQEDDDEAIAQAAPAPAELAEPNPETRASSSAELDAAIAATLAMDTGDANEVAAEAGAAGASIARDETSTPTTIYNAAASAGDVPAAVATPPPAAIPGSAAGAAGEAPKAKAASSLSRVAQLTARVEKDPLDGEAQLALLHDAEQKGDLERTREVYERFLSVFPDAAPQWISYCSLELAHNVFDRVEAIFGRCCRTSTSVDLWRFYLDYIRRVNPIDPANLELAKQARSIIGAAFDFALSHVGHDRRAGEIWVEYLTFLREAPTRGTWEDQQKMDALRKAFQRAVQAPVNNVEAIWQEYNAFENNLSKMTAKKFIAELSPAYMTARKTLRELRAQHDHLYTPTLPTRPDWSSAEQRDGLEGWKRYLAYEESNPLELEDPNLLHQRVNFAYRKAIANLRFHPEIWYLAATSNLKVGRRDDAHKQLREGLTANPDSLLLAYTLADIEEGKPDLPACYAIYDSLIEHLNARVAQLEAEVAAETADAVAERDEAHQKEVEVRVAAGGEDDSVEEREKHAAEIEELKKEVADKKRPHIETVKKAIASAWIAEMRFARRSDGLKQARNIFLRAKKSPNLAWQVVEASATMEMYWNSEPKVATNVFELGLKLFSEEPDYVLRYLEFLIEQNNANNARALFERTVALLQPAQAKPIWDRMAEYEYQYGDHLAAQKMAQRYAEAFPQIPSTVRFAQKHQQLGLEGAFSLDLGPSFVRQIKPSAAPGSPALDGVSRSKRGHSVEPDGAYDQDGNGDAKRARRGASPSPAPAAQVGGAWQGPHRQSAPQAAPALNRAQPFMLDPMGRDVAILPDAVVFFLSLLPPAASFNGPHLNPATIMDIIGTTILPGSAPGPGLPGERLGIPPRPKPQRPQYGGGGPPGGGYGGGRRF
ncbi:cleavage polyadenylation factor subunit RNA14 [Rhodotorula paludigena]|uniref:cleavage polyadenylation factor subunit RNA14 n=1 Tax=Rhodotorula paludigena TaxID=86838 RepID=UPI0031817761